MKLNIRIAALGVSIALAALFVPASFGQSTTASSSLNIALQRGYRTGYSDGYMAGYRDTIDTMSRDWTRHDEYKKADRAYNKDYGTVEDYRDGYQQGFESGYASGFDKKSFESTLPTDIKRRGTVTAAATPVEPDLGNTQPVPAPVQNTAVAAPAADAGIVAAKTDEPITTYAANSGAVVLIPRDTELMLELQEDLSTERNREGDKFTAKVVSPSEIAGAIVEGRISKIVKPGRIKRRSQMTLSFDRIIISDQRWSNFSASLTEVMPIKGDNIKAVDNEGTAVGRSSFKSDGIKVGAATGAGLVTGAVIAGPVGAAVGAGVGAAFGVGAVVIERGKHVNITRNQQIRIKTSYETQIR